MKIKPIIAAEMKKLFYLDDTIPEGIRRLVSNTNSIKIGDAAGTLTLNGYYSVRVNGKNYRNHRIIFAIFNNIDLANEIVDHQDRNKQNNHPSNLRIVTNEQNSRNKTKAKNTSSNYVGVSWYKPLNKWQSHICINKKLINLGYFLSEISAARAYNDYIITHNLSYFNLNEI